MHREDREFMRKLLLRHQKATELMFRRFDATTDEIRRRTDEIRRRTDAVVRKIDEGTDATVRKIDESTAAMVERIDAGTEALREHTREFVAETRAQRQALFRILDRLDEGGAGAGA